MEQTWVGKVRNVAWHRVVLAWQGRGCRSGRQDQAGDVARLWGRMGLGLAGLAARARAGRIRLGVPLGRVGIGKLTSSPP